MGPISLSLEGDKEQLINQTRESIFVQCESADVVDIDALAHALWAFPP
jgi:hypothetical protein